MYIYVERDRDGEIDKYIYIPYIYIYIYIFMCLYICDYILTYYIFLNHVCRTIGLETYRYRQVDR